MTREPDDPPDFDEEQSDWRTPEARERDMAQAKALRAPASRAGLRFDVYLPPELAEWVLNFVADGVFTDPSEAVFVMLGEQRDLAPHADLRREILKRSLKAAMDDLRPTISMEEFDQRMQARLEGAREAPAEWIKTNYSS